MLDNKVDLNLIRLFVTVVESRSLSEAAQRSGMTRSNMSHRLKSLELMLGAQLLTRTTRRMELTQAGELLYARGARMLEEVDAARTSIDSLGQTVSGDVRIRLPTGLGRLYLAPLLLDFARQYPDISLRVMINDHIGDLISSEVDIALKITFSPPLDQVALRLCSVFWCLCAAPAFLQVHAGIHGIADLGNVDLIAPASMGRRFALKLERRGEVLLVQVTPRLQSGDYPFIKQATLGGLGVALLPRYTVWRELAGGQLKEVLPDFLPEGVGDSLYLLTAPNRFPTLATRTLLNFITEAIARHEVDWQRAA